MTTYALEPHNADGSPRKLVGTHRPAAPPPAEGAFIVCSCGRILKFISEGVEHWQAGHFDTPLYEVGDD